MGATAAAGEAPRSAQALDSAALAGFASPGASLRLPKGNNYVMIVESPNKVKAIQGYLRELYPDGPRFRVLPTVGHIRDLPERPKGSKYGVDTRTWEPEWELAEGKMAAVKAFLDASRTADGVFIASDPDREGEAIAYHVQTVLTQAEDLLKEGGVAPGKISRVAFREITTDGIMNALAHARAVDTNMVDAQVARRVLDRLVGWITSKRAAETTGLKGVSAGRVQSQAALAVVMRDRERENHIPIPYGSVSLKATSGGVTFEAELTKAGGMQVVGPDKEGRPGTKMLLTDDLRALSLPGKGDKLYLINAETKPGFRAPKEPFTSDTLCIAASNALGLSTKDTMDVAQTLFDVGLINYHRSDSPAISESALRMARAYISKTYGAGYLPNEPRQYKAEGEFAQEGHECIRPTHIEEWYAKERAEHIAEAVAKRGTVAAKLLDMIERRFVASQMTNKRYQSTVVHLGFGSGEKALVFKANGNVTEFDGFTRAFGEEEGDEKGPGRGAAAVLPPISNGGPVVIAQTCTTTMKQTKPKPAHTEATLLKEMKGRGIGRPSTYASMMATILKRGYVTSGAEGDRNNVLTSTELGRQVVDALLKEFPKEMDPAYTAQVETNLDQIEHGKMRRETFLDRSYGDLKPHEVDPRWANKK